MTNTIEDILESFSYLDEWEDRYRYVIELGRDLSPFPEDKRDLTHKVQGCVSQVWLVCHKTLEKDPILTFQGDSDGQIVRGLVYILLAFYSGKKASEITNANVEKLLSTLGLDENLTPQRSNGLKSLINRIKEYAKQP